MESQATSTCSSVLTEFDRFIVMLVTWPLDKEVSGVVRTLPGGQGTLMDGGMRLDGARSLDLGLAASTAREGTETRGPLSKSESKGALTGPGSGRWGAGGSWTTAETVSITPERGFGPGLETTGDLEGGCDGEEGGSGPKSFPVSNSSLSSHKQMLVETLVELFIDWEPGDLAPNTLVLKKSMTSTAHLHLSGCRSSFR